MELAIFTLIELLVVILIITIMYFNSLRELEESYNEVNARVVELARQLKESNIENKELKEIRLQEVKNNTILINNNRELTKLLKTIKGIAEANNYNGRTNIQIAKIKEVIQDRKIVK